MLLLSLRRFQNSIKKILKVSPTRRPPQVMLVRWGCRTRLLLQLSVSSSHRSSCAAAAVYGSAAPLPPAGPPAPPSRMTQPPPRGAPPQHACSPPPGPPLTARTEVRGVKVETPSVCQGFWAARTQRIQKGSGRSSDLDRATPCCTPDEGSRFHWFALNQIL